jgi:hypothetical protein
MFEGCQIQSQLRSMKSSVFISVHPWLNHDRRFLQGEAVGGFCGQNDPWRLCALVTVRRSLTPPGRRNPAWPKGLKKAGWGHAAEFLVARERKCYEEGK